MAAITDLDELLRSLRPALRSEPYVMCLVTRDLAADIAADAVIVESEGVTVVVPQVEADRRGLAYDFVAGWITLTVHSSLEAVGLTAAVSGALAAEGISANMLAAFHHDHLLVPWPSAEMAMTVIEQLSARS